MSLPSGYKMLEYIQSSGTQYINTGFNPKGTTKVVFDFQMVNQGTSQQGVFGSRPGTSGRFTVFTGQSGTSDLQVDYNTEQTLASVSNPITGLNVNDRTVIEVSNSLIINGNTIKTVSAVSFTSTYSLFLFANNNVGTAQIPGTLKLYSCQIYDNGTLVRDFIPCKNVDGTVGLWDDVNGVFYGNAGTGTFTEGPVVAIAVDSLEITELEYIQSSGTQFIDSGFIPNQDTRIKVECAFVPSTTDTRFLLGSRSAANSNEFQIATSKGYYRTDYNKTHSNLSNTSYGNEKFYIDKNKNVTNLNNEYSATATYSSFSCPVNLYIFGTNNNGSFYNGATARVYTCRIYDNGTLIRDYIAAKLSDGTVGLYDKLHGLLYINLGTGAFTAGPVVITVPSTPLNFMLSSSTDTTVTLSWGTVENATGYKLYRNGSLLTILFSTSYTDTIEPFTDYVYTLTAYNEKGESSPAILDVFIIIPPAQPKYFNFIGANNSSIWLSWQPVNYADTYKLYRNDILLHETKDTKYIDIELDVNTQYNYTLVASNSSGDSPKSSILRASTISLDLVYDRTQEDGNRIAQYIKTKFSNLSEEQQAEWLSYHSKGGWNYTDLNRIEYWIGYITELLGMYIESLDDIPRFEASWDKRSNLYVEDVTHIQEVVELLKTKFNLTEFDWETMQRGPNWSYEQANAIERNLRTLYEQFYYMYIWPICGDTTCGGDYL